jgi:hypothetical protein
MTLNSKRSGDSSIDRKDEYYREEFEGISDREFSQSTFRACPALVSKVLMNGQRMWKPYYGGEFDRNQFDIVEGMWDHEHCSVCNFKITGGYSYWENKNRIKLLCDECHDYLSQA